MPLLTLAIAVPLAGAALAALAPRRWPRAPRLIALLASSLAFAALIATWVRFDTGSGLQLSEQASWIPAIGVSWRLAIDGMSLALSLMSCVLFLASIVYGVGPRPMCRAGAAMLLLLQGSTLAFFLAADFFLFYVAFDVTLVAMYFLIALWGEENRRYAALKFFLYTLVGSLPVLLGILSLTLAPGGSFDMIELIAEQPLAGTGLTASLTFFAFFVGFAIKTPVFPFHTWLPAAHVQAPTVGSVLLAGVLLKMGTYGFVRVNLQMLPDAFAEYALAIALLALVSAIYGVLVALAQTDLKRMIAYTSINHMGYVVIGIAAAAAATDAATRRIALDGAILLMVAHGVVIAVLFFLAGFIAKRTGTREISKLGGLIRPMPVYGTLAALAFFAALGLPGLAQFPAELQIFLATLEVWPAVAVLTVTGILISAGLFLRALQGAFLGEAPENLRALPDLGRRELLAVLPIAALVVALGLYPALILDAISSASRFIGA